MLKITKHPFHLVSVSPYPFVGSISGLSFLFGLVVALHLDCYLLLVDGLLMLLFLSAFWWRDIVIEAVYLGLHTIRVQSGLRLGIFLFIVSEAFFFLKLVLGFFSFFALASRWNRLPLTSFRLEARCRILSSSPQYFYFTYFWFDTNVISLLLATRPVLLCFFLSGIHYSSRPSFHAVAVLWILFMFIYNCW